MDLQEYRLDKPQEECGVFGIYAPGMDVAALTYYGLYALQHRGQESAGIAVTDGTNIDVYKNRGLVSEVFQEKTLNQFKGHIAIGHVRFGDGGSPSPINAQPLVFNYLRGSVALANNGKLVNGDELRHRLAVNGSVFQSDNQSEVFVNLIACYSQNTIEEALMKCMIDVKGAYGLVVMNEKQLIGVRDPHGIKPLCIGRLQDAYIIASESCALDTIGATFLRDVKPGEIVIVDENGLRTIQTMTPARKAICAFEYVYLARPDSIIDSTTVITARRNMGYQLAKEMPLKADIVVPIPDSGTTAAAGYAEATGLPFREGIMKNRYIGRTFIRPSQKIRDVAVRLKLNPIREIVEGKSIVLIDDSLVRGTTSKKIIQLLRSVNAKEIHMLITAPPVAYPCFYGIDTSQRDDLIATNYDLEGTKQYIGADSLYYLSLEGLLNSFGEPANNFCTACFNGDYVLGTPSIIEK